jgi:aspartate aminotransferase-like enzyme
MEVAGGFGAMAVKIFRIGVMGSRATEPSLDLFLRRSQNAWRFAPPSECDTP